MSGKVNWKIADGLRCKTIRSKINENSNQIQLLFAA